MINIIFFFCSFLIFNCGFIKDTQNVKYKRFRKTKQLIINGLNGKSFVINVNYDKDKVKLLQQKIEDKLGIPIANQSLKLGRIKLSTSKRLIDYPIRNLDVIKVNGKVKGGMHGNCSGFIFPSISHNKKSYGDIIYDGPSWRTVTSGLNIYCKCNNDECPSKGGGCMDNDRNREIFNCRIGV